MITAGLGDFGIAGKTTRVAKVFPKKSLTLDMFGNCFFRNFDYKLVTHARVFAMIPKFAMNEKIGLFLQTQFFCYPKFFGYNNMCSWNKVKDRKIELPTTATGEIDFEFMEARIRALEEARIRALDAYLESCGFENCELSDTEKSALADFPHKEFQAFRIGDLFKVYSPPKRFNANAVSFGGKYRYVARTSANNGIRGFITEDEKFLSKANTLAFGQDTATVFYQAEPYFTGDKIKVMDFVADELNENRALFLIYAIRKAFSLYSWGAQSFNETILKNEMILLPTKNGEIDFEFMENFITAQKKATIQKVIAWRDKEIAITKKIITES